ncbi:MAG: hypothetical protein ACREP2_11775 [Rhodanobacteraceae bacterium]
MTRLTVSLPDDLAQRARNAGLLSDNSIQRLLEDAMRTRDAGARLNALLAKVDAHPESAPGEAEIAEEIAEARRDAPRR